MKIKFYLTILTFLSTGILAVPASAQKNNVTAEKKFTVMSEKYVVNISDDISVTDFASRVQRVSLLKKLLERSLENKYDKVRVTAIISEMDGMLSQIQDSTEKTGAILAKVDRGTRFCDWFPCDIWDKDKKFGGAWAKYNSNNQGSMELSRAVRQQASAMRMELNSLQKAVESGNPPANKWKINWEKVWTACKCAGGIAIGLYGGITGNEGILDLGTALIEEAC